MSVEAQDLRDFLKDIVDKLDSYISDYNNCKIKLHANTYHRGDYCFQYGNGFVDLGTIDEDVFDDD